VFTQAKTSESWSKAEINVFESAISDFLSDHAAYPHSVYMTNAREVFDAVLKHVGRIRDGKPKAEAFSPQPPEVRKIRKFSRRRPPSKRLSKGPATLAALRSC
jgi:hypothetical protein